MTTDKLIKDNKNIIKLIEQSIENNFSIVDSLFNEQEVLFDKLRKAHERDAQISRLNEV